MKTKTTLNQKKQLNVGEFVYIESTTMEASEAVKSLAKPIGLCRYEAKILLGIPQDDIFDTCILIKLIRTEDAEVFESKKIQLPSLQTPMATQSVVPVIKRGRGRPLLKVPTINNIESESVAPVIKRGRGRPSKVKAEPIIDVVKLNKKTVINDNAVASISQKM